MFASITDLYDEVQQWADRYDTEFVDRLPSFSRLVEQNTYRNLRVPSMEKVLFADVDRDGRFPLPSDLLEPRAMSFTSWEFIPNHVGALEGTFDITDRKILNRSQDKLTYDSARGRLTTEFSTPVAYGRVGVNQYQLTPYSRKDLSGGDTLTDTDTFNEFNSDADKVEIVYYSSYPELSTGNTSNWLLEVAPELYLCGMLYYANLFVRDEEQAAYWRERYESAKTSLQSQADKSEEAGGYIKIPGSL